MNKATLYIHKFDTILGEMTAIGDDEYLYLLEFTDKAKLPQEINKLKNVHNAEVIAGTSKSIKQIHSELQNYFAGKLKKFETPIKLTGTPFQKSAWQELLKIPYGETSSYSTQSLSLGAPKSYRAVANTNGKNQFVIIIPCHRIIKNDGSIGGYSCGIDRKVWLLEHEKKFK